MFTSSTALGLLLVLAIGVAVLLLLWNKAQRQRNAYARSLKEVQREQHQLKQLLESMTVEVSTDNKGDYNKVRAELEAIINEAVSQPNPHQILLSAMANHCSASIAGMYHYNGRELEFAHGYAWTQKPNETPPIAVGTGLSGKAAADAAVRMFTDLPPNMLEVVSGLGSAEPGWLLAVPYVHEGQLLGLVELAGFGERDASEADELQVLTELLGNALAPLQKTTA